jgi:predicted permease
VAGGAAGILLARLTRDYIWAARPPMLRSLDFQIPLDTRVLLFTLVVSVVAGIVFGLAPAIRISRPDLNADLKDRAGIAPPSGRLNARSTLVVMQVALSLVALVGAGLFLRSLGEAQRTDLGFKVENLAILQFNLASQGYDEARGRQFIREISERVSALPGVSSVGVSGLPPFAGGFQRSVQIDGREEGPGRLTLASPAMPGYLKTMGIGLLRGRDFAPTDLPGSTRVAIVNEIMASRYWPGEDPIGRRFRFFGDEMPYEVVGVARTATYLEIGEQPRPNVYTCMLQNYSPMVAVHARVTGNENGQLATMRREFRALDPNLYVEASTMSRSVLEALWGPRLAAGLLVVFGFLALVLTAVGLHGVIGHTVQLRTRELGIRMAIGATPGGVVRMIVLEGVKLVALGIGIGAAIAGLVSRVVRSMLFGLSPTDVSTFIAVPMLLIVVAVFACWMPARRATRIDPLQALHSD